MVAGVVLQLAKAYHEKWEKCIDSFTLISLLKCRNFLSFHGRNFEHLSKQTPGPIAG